MTAGPRTILMCSCEETVPLDAETTRRVCRGARVATAHQLCRAEVERFSAALSQSEAVTVTCTQEAPLFAELAERSTSTLAFANIRENAGWSADAARAAPKIA